MEFLLALGNHLCFRYLIVIWIYAIALGCVPTATGSPFNPVDLRNDQAVIYLYLLKEAAGSFDILANDEFITTLYNEGYYPYVSSPGRAVLSARGWHGVNIALDVEAGGTYFVKLHMKDVVNPFKGSFLPIFMIMPKEIGIREISSCRVVSHHKLGLGL